MPGRGGNPGLEAAVQKWLEWLLDVRRLSAHTHAAYGADLEAFFDFLREHQGSSPTLKTLETLELQDFRAWLSERQQRGLAAASTARALAVLRSFFRFLKTEGHAENAVIF